MATLSRGEHTWKIPLKLFALNRQRLCAALKKAYGDKLPSNSAVLLQGGEDTTRFQTDSQPFAFRQESFFFWAFGCYLPDCYGLLDVCSGKSVLLVPELGESYAIWSGRELIIVRGGPRCIRTDGSWCTADLGKQGETGKPELTAETLVMALAFFAFSVKPLAEYKQEFEVDHRGPNTDSGQTHKPAEFNGIDKFKCDFDLLFPVISECRVFKTDMELDVLRYICKASSDAHKAMMRNAKPGLYEYQNESFFLFHTSYNAGSRHPAYTCIAGSGHNCSVLHYGHAGAPNDRHIKDGDLCLCDMGGEYFCYSADITTSFPVNGKFTDKQKAIYNIVLDANQAVMKTAKPGVSWVDMHKLAERTILTGLKAMGLVKGDVDEMLEARLGAIFMPHGLGHFLGLDVHDVGGYLKGCPPRIDAPGLRSLRTARVLEARMFITIEPGCYFIDSQLDKAFKDDKLSKYMVKEKIEQFRGFGGVRIEDDVLITDTGTENFSIVPRTVEEIESWMAGGSNGER